MTSLQPLIRDLSSGAVTSRKLVEDALARISAPDGEGPRTFVRVFGQEAIACAESIDRMRSAGIVPSPIAGVPISVKDLLDVSGYVTLAGSKTREQAPAAQRDAAVVSRLRRAGAIIVGTTNMTEFAMGGLGLNPHFGDCRNPWDRSVGRIPGGSSSGAAVSVTDGMAVAALGSDTMGSVRIPAALCGVTGFKPTAARVPLEGVFPLSPTLDSIGPLAPTVACCAAIDAVLADEAVDVPPVPKVRGLRLGLPKTLVLDDLERPVAQAFEKALARLSEAGAQIEEFEFPELLTIADLNKTRGLSVIEGWAIHRRAIEDTGGSGYDPRVRVRFTRAKDLSAADYFEVLESRRHLTARAPRITGCYDAVVMPTVPVVAPPIAQFTSSEDALLDGFPILIRNTSIANFLDRCALTIPCHEPGAAPVGFQLMGERMSDGRLLSLGVAIESVIRQGMH